jgi:hypothetical protein
MVYSFGIERRFRFLLRSLIRPSFSSIHVRAVENSPESWAQLLKPDGLVLEHAAHEDELLLPGDVAELRDPADLEVIRVSDGLRGL